MIAAMALLEYLDPGAAEHPFVGEVIAAAIGGLLFEAGRFNERKLAQTLQHLREARTQESKEGAGKRSLGHSGVHPSSGTVSRQ